jgi:hypothetical protein
MFAFFLRSFFLTSWVDMKNLTDMLWVIALGGAGVPPAGFYTSIPPHNPPARRRRHEMRTASIPCSRNFISNQEVRD